MRSLKIFQLVQQVPISTYQDLNIKLIVNISLCCHKFTPMAKALSQAGLTHQISYGHLCSSEKGFSMVVFGLLVVLFLFAPLQTDALSPYSYNRR